MSEFEKAAVDKIKLYQQQIKKLEAAIVIAQNQILTVVELMGWDALTANGHLGEDVFAIPVDLPQSEEVS